MEDIQERPDSIEAAQRTPIGELPISNKVKVPLKNVGITTLEKLLATNYRDLENVRHLGQKGLAEIKDYVHKLGYKLDDEEYGLSEREIRAINMAKGIPMIEALGLDPKTWGTLYRNGIYTVLDLLRERESAFSLPGMGSVKRDQLEEAMEGIGIDFNAPQVSDPTEIEILEIINKRLGVENEQMKTAIAEELESLPEYSQLLVEQAGLKAMFAVLREMQAVTMKEMSEYAAEYNAEGLEESGKFGKR